MPSYGPEMRSVTASVTVILFGPEDPVAHCAQFDTAIIPEPAVDGGSSSRWSSRAAC